MGTENGGEVIGQTLWGDPVYRVLRKRGRPPFEWTEENSHKVSMLLAVGWTNDRIAGTVLDPRTGLRISVPTLKRHFRAELAQRDCARDQLEARQLMAAAAQAFGGNVGAQRLLDQLIEKQDRFGADARMRRAQDSEAEGVEPAPRRLGKKEAAAEAARNAGGEDSAWGADLLPGFRGH